MNSKIEVLLSAVFFAVAVMVARCDAREYETYAGQKFEIYMEGELGQWAVDTVEVISKTERQDETELRIVGGGRRIVRPPDFINKLEE